MSIVRANDPDFRVCQLSFDDLLELQLGAERAGYATRWSSVQAMRGQVREAPVLLQPFLRESRNGEVWAIRCFVLYASATQRGAGEMATLDVEPEVLRTFPRVDEDPRARSALRRVFNLASGGIREAAKK